MAGQLQSLESQLRLALEQYTYAKTLEEKDTALRKVIDHAKWLRCWLYENNDEALNQYGFELSTPAARIER
jgi:hypothetical protein